MWKQALLATSLVVLFHTSGVGEDKIATTDSFKVATDSCETDQLLRTLIELERTQLLIARLELQRAQRDRMERIYKRSLDTLETKQVTVHGLEGDLRELDEENSEERRGYDDGPVRERLIEALRRAKDEVESYREDVDTIQAEFEEADADVLLLERELAAVIARRET